MDEALETWGGGEGAIYYKTVSCVLDNLHRVVLAYSTIQYLLITREYVQRVAYATVIIFPM